ncbi:MAG TPA: AI-2E family transporter, partial [Nitrospiria bacterium]
MTDTGKWFLLACALLAAAGLYFLGPVLTPFAIAALLAYLGNPLVDRLQSWKLPRKPAVIAVFIVIFLGLLLLVILLVPLLERQTAVLLGQIPAALDWIHQTGAPWLERTLGLEEQLLDINRLKAAVTAHWQEAGGLAQTMLASATRSGRALLGWLAGMALIPVITFYLLLDWNLILKRIDAA